MKVVLRESTLNGWIKPSGEFIPVNFEEHEDYAKKVLGKKAYDLYSNPIDALILDRKYVRVAMGWAPYEKDVGVTFGKNVTEEQLKVMRYWDDKRTLVYDIMGDGGEILTSGEGYKELVHDLNIIKRDKESSKENKEVKEKINEFSSKDKITKTFKITSTPEVMRRFENFLSFMHFNSGHSGLFAMSFDGDGYDVLKCEPEPDKYIEPGKKDMHDVAGYGVEIANENGYQGLSVKDKWDSYSSPDKEEEK